MEIYKISKILILDGQQRLTSLYQSLYSQNSVRTKSESNKETERYYFISIDRCLDTNEDRYDSVISVPSDKKIKENFDRDVILDLSSTEKEYLYKVFPLNILFGNDLLKWIIGYMNFYKNNEKAIKQLELFKEKVIDTITSYKLPVITLGKETDREAVCKVFENVNTGGVPLTVFELVTASFATYKHGNKYFNLREDLESCKKIIQGCDETLSTDIFSKIDETLFLTTVTLYTSYMDKINGVSS